MRARRELLKPSCLIRQRMRARAHGAAEAQKPEQATHVCARRELLKPSASIALHRHSNALVDILPPEADSSISLLSQSERPDVTYQVRLYQCMLLH
jgi:hypothetical protein